MNCLKTQEYFTEYFEGRLEPLLQHELQKHLEDCKACRDFFNKLSEVFQLIEADKETSFDPFMYTRIQARIDKNHQNQSVSATYGILRPVFISLLVIMIVFAGISLGKSYYHTNIIANDYETELYYLSDIHQDNIESLILSE